MPQKQKKDAPKIRDYPAKKIAIIDFDIICRVLHKRLSKGFSAEELSFLLGKPRTYIADKETLKSRPYVLYDMELISQLDGHSLSRFFNQVGQNSGKYEVFVRKSIGETQIVHEAFRLLEGGESELLFKVSELNRSRQAFKFRDEQLHKELQSCVPFMVETDFFRDGCSGMRLFSRCETLLQDELSPWRLIKVLDEYCAEVKPVLKCIRTPSGFRYVSSPDTEKDDEIQNNI